MRAGGGAATERGVGARRRPLRRGAAGATGAAGRLTGELMSQSEFGDFSSALAASLSAPLLGALDPSGDGDYTIGDLAREFDVTLRALRFYEAQGLLNPRRDGQMRLYGVEDRARLTLILKGKSLGFTLREIRALIEDRETRPADGRLALSAAQIEDQLDMLRSQRQEIDQAIAQLEAERAQLIDGA